MNPKLVLFLAFAVASLEAKLELPPGMPSGLIASPGQVGGKTYWINFEELTWVDAVQFCKDRNMRIATVTNSADVDYLVTELTRHNFHSHFWVAGRREVVWSTNGQVFDNEVLGQVDYFAENECMAIRVPRAEYPTQWRTIPCTDKWQVMCEEASCKVPN